MRLKCCGAEPSFGEGKLMEEVLEVCHVPERFLVKVDLICTGDVASARMIYNIHVNEYA